MVRITTDTGQMFVTKPRSKVSFEKPEKRWFLKFTTYDGIDKMLAVKHIRRISGGGQVKTE